MAPQLRGSAASPPRGLARGRQPGLRWGRPAPRRGSHPSRPLTQKTKLKTKSRYLMHLVQPSTPMVARAAGSLRSGGRSWAVWGAGPSEPGVLAGGREAWRAGTQGRG